MRPSFTTAATLSLPGVSAYADFLLKNHLGEFARQYMQAYQDHGIDPADYFPANASKTVADKFFDYAQLHLQMIAEDRSGDQIAEKLRKFFPAGDDDLDTLQAKSANIFLLAFIRKKVLKKFLPLYTQDIEKVLQIVSEMDEYSLVFEKTINEAYMRYLTSLLHQKDEQLLEAQHLSGTGSYIWNVQESKGDATPELLRMLNIDSMAKVRDHIANVHRDDWKMIVAQITEAIQQNGSYEFRYRFTGETGEHIILTKGKVTSNDVGQSIVKGTVIDITEVEQLVHQLEQSQSLYKEAQSLARMGNWSWNNVTDKVRWSEEVFHICELDATARPLDIRTIRELIADADWKEMKRQFRRLRESGEPISHIGTIRLKSGREKILEIRGKVSIAGDGSVHSIGTIQDVSWEQRLIRALQETEERYRHMEHIAHIGNWVIDIERNDFHITDEFLRIYDIEPGARPVTLEEIRSFVVNHHRQELDKLIERCSTTGEPYTYEMPILTAKGKQKIILARGEAVRDDKGAITRIAGTAQDITEQRMLLNNLQRSEVLYKQAQTIGSIGNWVYHTGDQSQEWSDEVFHIFELSGSQQEAVADARKMIFPSDLVALELCFKRCAEFGVPFDFKYRAKMPDGRVKHLRSKGELLPDKALQLGQMVGTVQDITEQVLIEKQLLDNQRFTQKITDIAPSIIAVINLHTGGYDYVSLAVENILGYKREDLLINGLSFINSLVHPEDVANLTEQNNKALEAANARPASTADEIVEFKYRLKHRDGDYRWIQTFGTVFDRDDAGKVKQILNISIDITGEKQAEEMLSHKNHLLQQSNSSLEEFAYIASHDLQEPLRKISTFGNMLETLQEDNLSDSGKMYIRKIVDSSIRMQGMINDILSVSLVSGNRSFKQENLQSLLDEVLLTLEHKIEQTKARIDVQEALPEANVIASQFRQLFQNLIGNSLKFAKQGVPPIITISYSKITGSELPGMDVDPEKAYLRLVVADNGIGFSNNYAGKIFAIFQRLNGKSEYEGTGIGLAVCKKIVEHHKGVISASGEPRVGATFTIIIPE